MPYGYHPATHFPWGTPRTSVKPATPRPTWGINQRGHITGEITEADYCRLIDAGRHGDKAAIAELQRRDAITNAETADAAEAMRKTLAKL